jgi:hypothetical protein
MSEIIRSNNFMCRLLSDTGHISMHCIVPYIATHETHNNNNMYTGIIHTAISGCPRLSDPNYGSVAVSGYTPGSTAQYSCNGGYKLVGLALRKCYNGRWTGKEPVCQSKHHVMHQQCHTTGYTMVTISSYVIHKL